MNSLAGNLALWNTHQVRWRKKKNDNSNKTSDTQNLFNWKCLSSVQNVSVSVNSNKAVETKWTVLMALHQEPPAPKTIITCRLPLSDFPLRIFLKFTPDTSANLTGLQAQCCSVCYEMYYWGSSNSVWLILEVSYIITLSTLWFSLCP